MKVFLEKTLSTPAMVREARETGRGKRWILELLIFAAFFVVASTAQSIPVTGAVAAWLLGGTDVVQQVTAAVQSGDVDRLVAVMLGFQSRMPDWVALVNLFSTVLMTVLAILFCRVIEKRGVRTMGLRREGAVREYLLGAAAALVLMGSAVGLAALAGGFELQAAGPLNVGLFLLYLLGFLVQGMSEEVICRGYLMVSISRKNPLWLGILLSSLVFAVLHLANPGITFLAFVNLILCGATFAVYILKRGSIWGACALHSLWNFFQGNLFGVSVSGTGWGSEASVLRATAKPGMELWSGGAFGIEGSLPCTLVLLAALAVLLFAVPSEEKKEAAS